MKICFGGVHDKHVYNEILGYSQLSDQRAM